MLVEPLQGFFQECALVTGFLEGMALPWEGDQLAFHTGFLQGLVQFTSLGNRDADVGFAVDHKGRSGYLVGEEDGRALQKDLGLTVRRRAELIGEEEGDVACALHGK